MSSKVLSTDRFIVKKDWYSLGYKIVFSENGETIVYDHDKNYKYWRDNVRKNEDTEMYGGGHTPPWIIKMKSK